MTIQRLSVYSHHSNLQKSAFSSFSSQVQEEKDLKPLPVQNSQEPQKKKHLINVADEFKKLRETDMYFDNARKLIIASTIVGVIATAAWLYLLARGPALLEKLQRIKIK